MDNLQKRRVHKVVAIAAIILSGLGLTGCPTPIPSCARSEIIKPGIDMREFLTVGESLPEGTAVVFGQFIVEHPVEKGVISVRLVSHKDSFSSEQQSYGEEQVWIEPDGKFQWILPLGHYVIQPIRFHFYYRGVNYLFLREFDFSLIFDVSETKKYYYLGTVNILLSSELDSRDIEISNDLTFSRSHFPVRTHAKPKKLEVNLVRYEPDLEFINVAKRKVCRVWSPISWCFISPFGGGCIDKDK
jgi:hypothetical protein